ncbi:MAG TPA: hypothetical protein VFG08_06675, partial [Candidatus Polarisedimenticolia bacterium]|nr:hypothetical protein [Candidatus Polarisedimenticolia bacterium]
MNSVPLFPGLQASRHFLVPLTILAACVLAIGCSQLSQDRPAPLPATPEELLTELRASRDQIDEATGRMMERLDQFNATRTAGQPTIQFSEIFTEELSPEQRDILNSMLAEEQDISYRALLQTIINDRDLIRGLQEKTLRLEQALPDKFVLAKAGDTHSGLAGAFLRDEAGLEPERADKLLANIDQTDELLPGNQVWFFYNPEQDVFRTYVTAGEAGRTPLAVRRAKQRQLIGERDAARTDAVTYASERDAARADVDQLQRVKADLESDIDGLQHTRRELESNVSRLSSDLAFQTNSLFYHAASIAELKDKGVLTRVLKNVDDMRDVQFDTALDLRRDTTITLRPEVFGLESIRNVKLLPDGY